MPRRNCGPAEKARGREPKTNGPSGGRRHRVPGRRRLHDPRWQLPGGDISIREAAFKRCWGRPEGDSIYVKTDDREICLAARPSGIPTAADFTLVWTDSGTTERSRGAGP